MTTPAHELARSRLFLTVEDVDLIISLVKDLPVKFPVIADIGAGSGTTALAVMSQNSRAKLTTIDINAENVGWTRKNVEPYYSMDRWNGIVSDSVEAAKLFDDRHFHMVMLDTSHEYEATKQEIVAWLPKLKHNGVFWFHDYIGSQVDKAVDEAVKAGLLTKIAKAGLGWAGRKT